MRLPFALIVMCAVSACRAPIEPADSDVDVQTSGVVECVQQVANQQYTEVRLEHEAYYQDYMWASGIIVASASV